MKRRKLIKVAEFKPILAEGFRVEGTKLYVLELLMFGFAYTSRYILLNSSLEKLRDEKEQKRLSTFPHKYGKQLELGKELEYDSATQCVYYLGKVTENKILHDEPADAEEL